MSDLMRTYPVREVVEHGKNLKSLRFDRVFDASPGQFVMLWVPGLDEKPFSISHLDEGRLEITIKAVGPTTRSLMEVSVGDHLGLRGPFGHGFSFHDRALLVGGGCGIAPLRFLHAELERREKSPSLLLGVRTASDLLFPDELARAPRATILSEDGSIGEKGIVTDRLAEVVRLRGVEFLAASGPEAMLVAVREIAMRLGLRHELNLERYMKCGIGICGQCCLDGSGIRLCVEGPVLSDERLEEVTELGMPHRDATGRRPAQPPT